MTTPKTIEEIIEEITRQIVCDPITKSNLRWLIKQAITTERQAADERLRLILPRVQKFIDKVESGRARSKETYEDMLFIRDLIAKHGITNL